MRCRLYGIGIFCLIIMGCAHSGTPDMPNFTTEEQKVCARNCQEMHARCSTACRDMFGDVDMEEQRQACQDNCNSVLGDCYDTCK